MKQLITLLLLIFILAACAAQPRTVAFNHTTYQIQSTSGDTATYRSQGGGTLQVERGAESTTVTVDGQGYRVTGTDTQLEVTFSDGRELSRQYIQNGAAGLIAPGVNASFEDWDRVDELREIVFHTTYARQTGQAAWQYLLCALLLVTGLLQVINPRLVWQLFEGWRYENLEPSEMYLGLLRLAGGVLIVVAIFVAFVS
jgi:hypothetical protein